MSTRRFPQSRAERLIALGRFVLSIASFGAIYLDPLEPSVHATLTYSLLAAYTLYSLLVFLWSASASTTSQTSLLVTHAVDIVFFGAINYFTFGPTSPFFIFFVFSILCAMVRFGRRGTLLTAVVAVVVFIASTAGRIGAMEFELNRFIIRLTYLFVLASMLIYVAGYQERLQHDLQRIARWPRSARRDLGDLLDQLMSEAASIFGAQRVLLAYRSPSGTVAYLYTADADGQPPERQEQDVADLLLEQETGTYFSSGSHPAARLHLDDSMTAHRALRDEPSRIHDDVVDRYDIHDVVATSFRGELVQGRLLLLDGRSPLLEEINLARITGAVVAGRLDQYFAAQQLQRGAVAEERVRVARDLHDSVLQALTGVALQLRTLPRLMARDEEAAQERLGEIGQVIGSAQKELRWFIDELRPNRTLREDDVLGERLTSLAQRFREQWGLQIETEVAPVVHLLPIGTRYEIYAIVNEAVANAAKHASARCVEVAVDVDDGSVRIHVGDDGRGFAFHGRHDLESLIASNRGPVTLKERVMSLGGSMVIDSSERGAKLEIRMPLHAQGV